MTQRTGPKISSWAMVMSFVTSANRVGLTKYPPLSLVPSGASGPPVTSLAPSEIPRSMQERTALYWVSETNGPIVAFGSVDQPTISLSIVLDTISQTSSQRTRGTNILDKALQDCPVLPVSCFTKGGTTRSKSASSRRTDADLPPNSVRTAFIVPLSAATFVSLFPALVLPVKLTRATSGCLARTSPQSGPLPITMLKTPLGRPASSIASANE
mmetsp:Transcript_6932/g.16932  ORF Transcript_6932/g.16932 Transcript_6932/m.16932 type:complete len:213 (-) Transcript_6932:871-1509(-)